MDYISVTVPAQQNNNSGASDLVELVVDIANDKVEFISADQKSTISLDLICAADFEKILHALLTSDNFRIAAAKKQYARM